QSTFGISKLLRWHKPGHEAKDKTTRDGRNGSLSPNAPTVLAEGSPPRRRQSKSVFVPAERFRPVHTDGNCGASYQRRDVIDHGTEPHTDAEGCRFRHASRNRHFPSAAHAVSGAWSLTDCGKG